jgi:hypothetical protein
MRRRPRPSTIRRMLHAGGHWIGGAAIAGGTATKFTLIATFGGCKQSRYRREIGLLGLEELLQIQSIQR